MNINFVFVQLIVILLNLIQSKNGSSCSFKEETKPSKLSSADDTVVSSANNVVERDEENGRSLIKDKKEEWTKN